MTIDLSTRYLGLNLRHPLMVGASPIVDDLVVPCAAIGIGKKKCPHAIEAIRGRSRRVVERTDPIRVGGGRSLGGDDGLGDSRRMSRVSFVSGELVELVETHQQPVVVR